MKKMLLTIFWICLFLVGFSRPAMACNPSCPGCYEWDGGCVYTCDPDNCESCISGHCRSCGGNQYQACCDGACYDFRTHFCCPDLENRYICKEYEGCCKGDCCDPNDCESCAGGKCQVCGGDPDKKCCDGDCEPKCELSEPDDQCDTMNTWGGCTGCSPLSACGTQVMVIYQGGGKRHCSGGCPGECVENGGEDKICYKTYTCQKAQVPLPLSTCAVDPPDFLNPTCVDGFTLCYYCYVHPDFFVPTYIYDDKCE